MPENTINLEPATTEVNSVVTEPATSGEIIVSPTTKVRKKTNEIKVSEAKFVQVYNDPSILTQKQVGEVLGIDAKLVSVKAFLARKKGLLTRNLGKGPRNSTKRTVETANG